MAGTMTATGEYIRPGKEKQEGKKAYGQEGCITRKGCKHAYSRKTRKRKGQKWGG